MATQVIMDHQLYVGTIKLSSIDLVALLQRSVIV